ncbi:MAG: BlaI/MecI/CopY family transcriptional regulator [Proteobacteria bacterium]|nr:BlaI/MecI/CopY family transcriptional regulator [Pseudomonadota bacterium]
MSKPDLRNKTALSRAQREVMEVIWDLGEVGVAEVTQALNRQRPMARNTVRTLMERMEEKSWLTHRVVGRSFVYSATVPREESLGQRVMDMVDKACGGKPEKLMLALMQYRGLSEDEAKRIRKMLDEAKEK